MLRDDRSLDSARLKVGGRFQHIQGKRHYRLNKRLFLRGWRVRMFVTLDLLGVLLADWMIVLCAQGFRLLTFW